MIVFDSLTGARTVSARTEPLGCPGPMEVSFADMIARGIYRLVCTVEQAFTPGLKTGRIVSPPTVRENRAKRD